MISLLNLVRILMVTKTIYKDKLKIWADKDMQFASKNGLRNLLNLFGTPIKSNYITKIIYTICRSFECDEKVEVSKKSQTNINRSN